MTTKTAKSWKPLIDHKLREVDANLLADITSENVLDHIADSVEPILHGFDLNLQRYPKKGTKVFFSIMHGYLSREVAEILGLHFKTVEGHRMRIIRSFDQKMAPCIAVLGFLAGMRYMEKKMKASQAQEGEPLAATEEVTDDNKE